MYNSIVDKAIVDKAIVGKGSSVEVEEDYNGIRVKSKESISLTSPIGIKTPKFDIQKGEEYTLQWKHCNKSNHDVFNHIYVGNQKLNDINLKDFKTVSIVEDYQEKLCILKFTANETQNNISAVIGRLQDDKDKPKTECFLIRDVQLEKGGFTGYKPSDSGIDSIYEKLQTKINQTSSEVSLMAKKTELNKLGSVIKDAEAKITVQAGLIENKVSEGDVSTLIRQSPTDIQYAFNGVNPRYVYTNDGFYMKANNGYNKASLRRGSFYCYNYNNGEFLGGLTPFVFEGDAGTGIINAAKSRFFVLGRDSSLTSDAVESASGFSTFLTLNFTDRVGEGSFYKKGLQVSTPTYFHDGVSFTGHDLTSINTINAQTLNITGTTDTDKLWSNIQYCSYLKDRHGYLDGDTWVNGQNVFYFGNTFCTNYRDWDWKGKNLTNCNWVGNYVESVNVSDVNNESIIDNIEVVSNNDKLGIVKNRENYCEDIKCNDNTFEFEQIIYSLINEVKELKKEIAILKSK